MNRQLLILLLLITSCGKTSIKELTLTEYSDSKRNSIQNYRLNDLTDGLFHKLKVGTTKNQISAWKTELISRGIAFQNDEDVFYINIPDEYSESESTTFSVSFFYQNDSLVSTKLFYNGSRSNSNFYQLKGKIEENYGSAIAEYESKNEKKTILGETYYPHNYHNLYWLKNNILIELEESEYGDDNTYYMSFDYTYIPFERNIINSVLKDEVEKEAKRREEEKKMETQKRKVLDDMF